MKGRLFIVLLLLLSARITSAQVDVTSEAEKLWSLASSGHDSLFLDWVSEIGLNLKPVLTEACKLKPGADSVLTTLNRMASDLTNTAPDLLSEFCQQLLLVSQARSDSANILTGYTNVGGIYSSLGEIDKALVNYYRALEMATWLGDSLKMCTGLNNVGNMHYYLGEFDNSIRYFLELIELAERQGYDDKLASAYLNISNPYYDKGDLKLCEQYLRKALDLAERIGDDIVQSYALGNLADQYRQEGRIQQAIDYQSRGLAIEERNNDNIAMIDSHGVLAGCYASLGNATKTSFHFQKAETIALSIGSKKKLSDLYKDGMRAFAKLSDFARAYEVSLKYQQVSDSIYNADRYNLVAEMREKFETAQKEQQISSLEEESKISALEIQQRRSQNLVLIIAAALLVLVLVFISVFLAQTKKSKREVDKRNETITKINKALNKSQDELIASNTTKDKFFAIIAHDLRGPITSMQGIGRMLAYYNRKGDETKINQLIEQVDQSASSVNHLLDNLLKWALAQTNGLNFQPTEINMTVLMEEIRIIFQEAFTAKQMELVINQDEEHWVEADSNMISTVIRNLVSNALKFSPLGGLVSVNLIKNDHQIKIEVADSGAGMPQETIEKVFKDQPVESTRGTSDEKGTGLGLVLCREFVRMHGADLVIESSPKGTSISFELTLAHQFKDA